METFYSSTPKKRKIGYGLILSVFLLGGVLLAIRGSIASIILFVISIIILTVIIMDDKKGVLAIDNNGTVMLPSDAKKIEGKKDNYYYLDMVRSQIPQKVIFHVSNVKSTTISNDKWKVNIFSNFDTDSILKFGFGQKNEKKVKITFKKPLKDVTRYVPNKQSVFPDISYFYVSVNNPEELIKQLESKKTHPNNSKTK